MDFPSRECTVDREDHGYVASNHLPPAQIHELRHETIISSFSNLRHVIGQRDRLNFKFGRSHNSDKPLRSVTANQGEHCHLDQCDVHYSAQVLKQSFVRIIPKGTGDDKWLPGSTKSRRANNDNDKDKDKESKASGWVQVAYGYTRRQDDPRSGR